MLSTEVYNSLMEQLLSRKIQPGDVLNRRQIAKEFDVSVAPVLEAFVQLEHEGFLRTIPRKGTVVRELTKQDIKGHLILKEAIECAAAERYSGDTVKMHYDVLSDMAKKLDSEYPLKDSMEAWKLDLDFHAKLVSLAGFDVLTAEYKKLVVPNLFYHVNFYLKSGEDYPHMQLLEALMSENKEYALQELKAHLRSGKKVFGL